MQRFFIQIFNITNNRQLKYFSGVVSFSLGFSCIGIQFRYLMFCSYSIYFFITWLCSYQPVLGEDLLCEMIMLIA